MNLYRSFLTFAAAAAIFATPFASLADDPVALPWIADALDWLRQALTTVTA